MAFASASRAAAVSAGPPRELPEGESARLQEVRRCGDQEGVPHEAVPGDEHAVPVKDPPEAAAFGLSGPGGGGWWCGGGGCHIGDGERNWDSVVGGQERRDSTTVIVLDEPQVLAAVADDEHLKVIEAVVQYGKDL